MSGISTSIELQDNFTSVLYQVINATNLGLTAMHDMRAEMGGEIDTSGIDGAREALNQATIAADEFVASMQNDINNNTVEQEKFNDEIKNGTGYAGELKNTIASVVGAYASIEGVKKALGFVEECTEAYNTQLNAENQLMSVLANTNPTIDVTADTTGVADDINAIQNSVDGITIPVSVEQNSVNAAFEEIKNKASEIQGNGIYGDEAMIAAGAEFATYFTDTNAITSMMDTLSNYAMGMTGGGEVGAEEMVNYATNLGKIMTGSYDAMTKKGFKFTDTQKAIIEGEASRQDIIDTLGSDYADMSQDMQAAAVISQIIDESWADIYDNMSNTPQGKIIQLKNTWGDMQETIGNRLYPAVLKFYSVITDNWGTVETVVEGITVGLGVLLNVLSLVAEGAFDTAQFFINNWSWIEPIIFGVSAALLVYLGYIGLVKAAETTSTVVKGALILAEYAHAAATGAEVKAATAATVAQWGWNAALLACPITWIMVAIVAFIALIYGIVKAENQLTGSTYSATGLICAIISLAVAYIRNQFAVLINFCIDQFANLWNFIAAFANFFANVFDDPAGAVARLFADLANNVLSILQSLASAIDTIFGSNLAGAVSGWKNSLTTWVDKKYGSGVEIMSKIDSTALHMDRESYGEALLNGYEFGEGLVNKFSNLTLTPEINIPNYEDYLNKASDNASLGGGSGSLGSGVGDIADNTSAIADNTSDIADGLSLTDEDLKLLREIAEREYINEFTTAEIKFEMTNNNNISSDMDIDGFFNEMTERVKEAVISSAEGVHA